jgi:site-specific recombinase XerD
LQNKCLKPATVRHVLELLRRLANFAVKKNYCRGLSFKLEMPKVDNQKTEELTQHQLQNLLRVLEEDPDLQVSNLVRMALYTGMRRGELFELCWSDIDFHHKTITVRSAKKGQHPTIPLNEMAEKVLAEHAHVEGSSKFVFPGRAGKKRTECKRPLLRIRKNAGLPEDFRLLQGLRHVYATKLVSSGKVDLETLQSLLTQKSPLMTQRYAHLLDQRVEVAEMEIATDYTDSEKARDYTESKIATDNTDLDSNVETPESVEATENTDNTDLDSNVETPESVEATDYTDYEIATDSTDYEIAMDSTDYEIATDNTDLDSNVETLESVEATDSTDFTESEIATDNTVYEIATDVDEIEEVTENVLESKTPELSQLVKQNYSAVKPKEIQPSEGYSQKNIVVEKKIEERVQQKARPTLKDLKNDLKSLSQLIQTAPRRSKVAAPKRNQS